MFRCEDPGLWFLLSISGGLVIFFVSLILIGTVSLRLPDKPGQRPSFLVFITAELIFFLIFFYGLQTRLFLLGIGSLAVILINPFIYSRRKALCEMGPAAAGEEIALPGLGAPPNFFSLAFHLRFLPAVIWRVYLKRKKASQGYQSPFANHMLVEVTLAVVVCFCLAVFGLLSLITKHSGLGAVAALVGLGGLIAMLVNSIGEANIHRKEIGGKYSYDYFVPSIFFFFIILGMSAGLSCGYVYFSGLPQWTGLCLLIGLIAGYITGIFAAVGINYLGWIGTYVIYLAFAAMAGLAILDAILLYMIYNLFRL